MKYTPTPLERMSLTTCTILSLSCLGMPSKSRCASSKKNTKLGLVGVAHLGQGLEERREHPQEEHRVDLRRLHELGGVEDVDVAAAVGRAGEPVGEVEVGLAEEDVTALVLDGQKRALDGADGLARHATVGGLVLLGVVGHIGEHGAQVLEVEQQHALVVGHAEDDVEHALLHVGEAQQAAEQHRTHVGDGDAHRAAGIAEHVPDAARGAR